MTFLLLAACASPGTAASLLSEMREGAPGTPEVVQCLLGGRFYPDDTDAPREAAWRAAQRRGHPFVDAAAWRTALQEALTTWRGTAEPPGSQAAANQALCTLDDRDDWPDALTRLAGATPGNDLRRALYVGARNVSPTTEPVQYLAGYWRKRRGDTAPGSGPPDAPALPSDPELEPLLEAVSLFVDPVAYFSTSGEVESPVRALRRVRMGDRTLVLAVGPPFAGGGLTHAAVAGADLTVWQEVPDGRWVYFGLRGPAKEGVVSAIRTDGDELFLTVDGVEWAYAQRRHVRMACKEVAPEWELYAIAAAEVSPPGLSCPGDIVY